MVVAADPHLILAEDPVPGSAGPQRQLGDEMAVVGWHVWHQSAAAGDVDHLHAAADREQWPPSAQAPPGDGQVEGILLEIDVVLGLVHRAAVVSGVQVAAAGSAVTDKERRKALAAHGKAVATHVSQLAKRDYPAQLPDAMDFLVCYVPSEELLAAAYEARPTLFYDAARDGATGRGWRLGCVDVAAGDVPAVAVSFADQQDAVLSTNSAPAAIRGVANLVAGSLTCPLYGQSCQP